MTTVFSAITMPKGGSRLLRRPDFLRSNSVRDTRLSASTLIPNDELPSATVDTVEPDLANLNTALGFLVQIFPGCATRGLSGDVGESQQ